MGREGEQADLEDGGAGRDHGEGGLDSGGRVGGGRGGDEAALQLVGGGGGGLQLALELLGRPLVAGAPAHEGVHAHVGLRFAAAAAELGGFGSSSKEGATCGSGSEFGTEEVKGGAGHAEGAVEVGLRVVGAAAQIPLCTKAAHGLTMAAVSSIRLDRSISMASAVSSAAGQSEGLPLLFLPIDAVAAAAAALLPMPPLLILGIVIYLFVSSPDKRLVGIRPFNSPSQTPSNSQVFQPNRRPTELAPLLVAAGVCFGFADPTTNIIANTLSSLPPDHSAKKRKRKTKAAPSAAAARSSSETRAIAERSLEGLVTFLTSYFRYLPTWDALRYLRLANTDLLVAVRLIELNRGCYNTKDERFQISSYAARAALTCAASSARQPNVDGFIAASFSLASHLEFVTQAVPGGLTISLRAVLLDKIHAKYIKAISRLPMQDVRAHYHLAFVNGGYCYGPFSCVTNIIINTLWYDSAFPAVEKLEVDMICTSTFVRVESRSLRGLIKQLLTCIPEIFEHDAMIYLLKNNLKVCKAVEMAGVKIEAALRKKGYLYDLQVICVANERVGSQMNFLDFKCPYSHVNFLASPKVGSGLKLFFAEFSNDDDDVSFCCTVSRKSKHGTRIMHPAHPIENYCGGDMDFTEMAHGTHELTNARIISGGKWAGNRVGMCGDDYIYFDPTRDAKFAQCMNRTASRANISWSDILRVNTS
ncbi:hypothetical protein OsJ_22536 [Oryza sativa Japonica Group]|uniref:Uncharacterized protein n=1 Tax=Oryza sativa subsp. japonica TaxID=39947 RepID=B9FQR3_ORYSJ|nr:hypothetical protein OsJ_22536 [Oryza sativa Japonica Group]